MTFIKSPAVDGPAPAIGSVSWDLSSALYYNGTQYRTQKDNATKMFEFTFDRTGRGYLRFSGALNDANNNHNVGASLRRKSDNTEVAKLRQDGGNRDADTFSVVGKTGTVTYEVWAENLWLDSDWIGDEWKIHGPTLDSEVR